MNRILFFIILSLIAANLFALNSDTLTVSNIENIRIDSILIKGNDTTEEFIILRELTFGIGDSVNSKSLEFNRERVYSLGIFNFVDFYVIDEQNKNKLLIDVDETWYIFPVPFFNLRENKFSKSSYGLNLLWKNFRGRNEKIRAILSFGYDPSYVISYFNPVFNEPHDISFQFDFGYTNFSNKSVTAELLHGNEFDYETILGSLTFGKRINQFNSAFVNIGYRFIEAPFDSIKMVTASGNRKENYPIAGIAYAYDSRDLAQFASEGLFAAAKLSHVGFGVSDVDYNIFEFDFREYRNLIGDLSGKWRFTYRHTFGKLVPFYDNSTLGFSEFVRGHIDSDRDGNNLILTSLEFNYPIVSEWDFSLKLPIIPKKLTSARISIILSAFGDSGVTYNNGQKIELKNFDSGWGFGVTFLFLPYNAFRLEYAFNEQRKGEFLIGTGFSF